MKLGAMSTMYQFLNVATTEYLERFAARGLKYVDLMTIGDLHTSAPPPAALRWPISSPG